MVSWLQDISVWIIPATIFLIVLAGFLRRVPVYEAFVEGAAEGFHTTIRLLPFLVAMMVAINVFRFSGALDECIAVISPLLSRFGIPPELTPLAIMRSLSGSGSLGMVSELFNTYGPDSQVGRIASTILASTDTTFYVLTIYFGSVGIRNPRYSVLVGLTGDLAGFLAAIYICKTVFS
ncbi:MAG: spmB [Anaerosporomusa subterranea]|jgi:spore maturation protein B|nr:spmB [Anaerosporomusa subterranea]